nr:unnamed protein product [Spirometra erinaceieuropaei]
MKGARLIAVGYPPPPQFPAAAPPYTAGVPTIIVQQPVVFGPAPVNLQCPYCQSQVLTSISHESGSLTWLAAALICILGGFCFCFLIPFCMDSCQDVRHECPHCHRTVGRFSRL